MLTPLLLMLGILFAPAGTFTYVWVAMAAPDPETLRLAKAGATIGRWTGYAGCALAVADGTSGQLALAAVALAATVATASFVTKLPPPQTPRSA